MLINKLLFVISLFGISPSDHAIYISVVEVSHKDHNLAEIRIKVFSDDLQDVIRNYAEEKGLSFATDTNVFNQLLTAYFIEKLQIEINSKQLRFLFERTSVENDATFLTFTSVVDKPWKVIEIHAPYFTELFPSQTNTFSIETPSRKYYGKTEKNEPNLSITLN